MLIKKIIIKLKLFEMKKKLAILFVLAGFVGILISTSCTKCDEETTSATFSKALINGDALANLDLTNDTNEFGGFEIHLEKVPAGTKIFANINSMDLDPNPSGYINYQELTFQTTVSSAGKYEIEVYAGQKNVDVTILADDFEYNQKINDSTSEWKVFSLSDQNVSIINNQVKYVNLQFN